MRRRSPYRPTPIGNQSHGGRSRSAATNIRGVGSRVGGGFSADVVIAAASVCKKKKLGDAKRLPPTTTTTTLKTMSEFFEPRLPDSVAVREARRSRSIKKKFSRTKPRRDARARRDRNFFARDLRQTRDRKIRECPFFFTTADAMRGRMARRPVAAAAATAAAADAVEYRRQQQRRQIPEVAVTIAAAAAAVTAMSGCAHAYIGASG
jgi:hypothetical protein